MVPIIVKFMYYKNGISDSWNENKQAKHELQYFRYANDTI